MSRPRPRIRRAAPRALAVEEAVLLAAMAMARDITSELCHLCAMLSLLREARGRRESGVLVTRLLPLVAARVDAQEARLAGLLDVIVALQQRHCGEKLMSQRHRRSRARR
jgi:hypothetical protein